MVRRLVRLSMCLALAVAMGAGFAFELRSAEHVVVGPDETVADDVYAAGATVTIDGTVDGDLVAMAREVRIAGRVTGDVIAAAQTIVIEGVLEDDARITGQTLYLREGAAVEGHVVAAGFHLGVDANANVRNDLAFGGRSIQMDGTLAGRGFFAVEAFHANGDIGGDVRLWLDPSEGDMEQFGWPMRGGNALGAWEAIPFVGDAPFLRSGLNVGDGARFGGDLTIVSQRDLELPRGVVAGDVSNLRPEEVEGLDTDLRDVGDATETSPVLSRIRRFLALAVVGLLGLLLMPRLVAGAGEHVRTSPWRSLGAGLLAIVAVPLASLVALGVAAVVAWLLDLVYLGSIGVAIFFVVTAVALLATALYVVALLFLVQPVVGHVLGRWVLERAGRQPDERSGVALLVGLLAIVLLAWIPAVGTALSAVVAIFGVGGLVIAGWRTRA